MKSLDSSVSCDWLNLSDSRMFQVNEVQIASRGAPQERP